MKELLAPIPVGIRWIRKSYGRGITGLPWKQIATNILQPVISVKSMLIKYMCLQFL